jgi:ABC-2 type transport system permease protein
VTTAAAPVDGPTADASGAPRGQLIWFLRFLRAFIRRELLALSGYRTTIAIRGLTFGLAVLSLIFFSRFVGSTANPHLARYGGSYLAFSVVGFLAAELQQVALSGLAQRIRMAQVMGVLEAELSTPAPSWMVLGVAPIYELASAALRSAAYLTVASLLLGVHFQHVNLPAVAVVVPLLLASFGGLGLLTAATTMLVRRSNPIAVVLGALSVLLSGVVYPVSVLPGWLQVTAGLLPLTHALEALRGALLTGASVGSLRSSLLALALFALILIPFGLIAFILALRRARIDGSLTHY